MLITYPCPHYFMLYQNDVGTVASKRPFCILLYRLYPYYKCSMGSLRLV